MDLEGFGANRHRLDLCACELAVKDSVRAIEKFVCVGAFPSNKIKLIILPYRTSLSRPTILFFSFLFYSLLLHSFLFFSFPFYSFPFERRSRRGRRMQDRGWIWGWVSFRRY